MTESHLVRRSNEIRFILQTVSQSHLEDVHTSWESSPWHRASSSSYTRANYGKEHELIASVKEIDLTQKRMMDHYKKHTKMTEANIKKLLLPPEDVWLSAQEAVKYGLADKVINGSMT